MRIRSGLQVGIMVLLAVGLTMCKQPDAPPADPSGSSTTVTPPEAGTAQAIEQEVKQIQTNLGNGRRHVRDGKAQEGSLELSEAASLFSRYAAASSEALKEELEFSASEFTGIAERVFGSSKITVNEIDAALTRAYWALALYHYRQGAQQWQARQRAQAAASLNATATFIDESIGYFSGGLETESETLVAEIRDLAQHLAARGQLDAEAVTGQIEDMGPKIEAYSQRVQLAIQENIEAAA